MYILILTGGGHVWDVAIRNLTYHQNNLKFVYFIGDICSLPLEITLKTMQYYLQKSFWIRWKFGSKNKIFDQNFINLVAKYQIFWISTLFCPFYVHIYFIYVSLKVSYLKCWNLSKKSLNSSITVVRGEFPNFCWAMVLKEQRSVLSCECVRAPLCALRVAGARETAPRCLQGRAGGGQCVCWARGTGPAQSA